RLAVALQHPALRVAGACAPPVIGLVSAQLDAMVLLEALKHIDQPILSIARDRLCLLGAVSFELTARDLRPLAPSAPTQHRSREHDRLQINLRISPGALLDRAALALLQPPLRIRQRLAATLKRA